MSEKKTPSEIMFNLICFGTIFVTLAALMKYLAHGNCWDAVSYCELQQAAAKGVNPYDLTAVKGHVTTEMGLTYPPLFLLYAKALCLAGVRWAHAPLYLALMAGAALWASRGGGRLFAFGLFFGGFHAFLVSAATGNTALYEFLWLLFALAWLAEGRVGFAAASIGCAAFLKLQPIVPALVMGAFLPLGAALYFGAVLAGTIAVLHMLGWLLYPELVSRYFMFIRDNLLGGGPGTIVEGSMNYNVSLKNLADELNGFGMFDPGLLYVLLAAPLGLGVCYLWRNRQIEGSMYLAVLLSLVMLPRLKDYSFILLLPPLYYLAMAWSLRQKCILLVIVNVVPVVMLLRSRGIAKFEAADLSLYSIVHLYYLLVCALAALCWAWWAVKSSSSRA